MLGRKFSSTEGGIESDGLGWRETFKGAGAPVLHQPGKIGELTFRGERDEQIKVQSGHPDECDFPLHFFAKKGYRPGGRLFWKDLSSADEEKGETDGQENAIAQKEKAPPPVAAEPEKNRHPEAGQTKESNPLSLKLWPKPRIKEGGEIAHVDLEKKKEQKVEKGKAEEKKRRGDGGDRYFPTRKKLDDKKSKQTETKNQRTVNDRKSEAESEDKRQGDFHGDVEVGEKESEEQTKE